MGIMKAWSGIGGSRVAQYGNHNLSTASVLDAVTDGVTPTSKINWRTDTPTVLDTPVTSNMQEADRAEREAVEYQFAVDQGCRKLKAEGTRQVAHAKLVKAHRKYLGEAAQAHVEIAGANHRLASKLHGLREVYAGLGHSLDRKSETADQNIDLIAQKYRGI